VAAPVYFADMRANEKQNLLDKLTKLYRRAGLGGIVAKGDLVALKVHFGERSNTAFLRPQYVRRLVDLVRKSGASRFSTTPTSCTWGGGPTRSITWKRRCCTVLTLR
jgi:hypothetical protein